MRADAESSGAAQTGHRQRVCMNEWLGNYPLASGLSAEHCYNASIRTSDGGFFDSRKCLGFQNPQPLAIVTLL